MFEERVRVLRDGLVVSAETVPLSGFAESRLSEFAAVLSARVEALGEVDQLDLGVALGSCIATLDWLKCKTASSFALKDIFSPVMAAQRGQPGAIVLRAYGGGGCPAVSELASTELALAWSCSETVAARLIAVGLDLRFRLRMTNHHFGGGRLGFAHARVISEVTRRLAADVVDTVEAQLAEAALTRTPGRLRLYARRLIAKADPAGMRARAAQAHTDRFVSVFALDDGVAAFCLNHQLETLAVIDDQLDAWSRQRHSADPTTCLNAHKADAAAHLLLGRHPLTGQSFLPAAPMGLAAADSARSGSCPGSEAAGRPPAPVNPSPVPNPSAVNRSRVADPSSVPDPSSFLPARTELRVTMTADTLLGIDDATAELEGFGPITAAQARRLALQSSSTVLRRVFCDPTDDSVLFLDANRYRWSRDQTEAAHTLHPYSTFPGATTPARKCDLDHRIPHINDPPDIRRPPDGERENGDLPDRSTGRTVVTNAQPLGRRHHRAKTHGGWTVTADPTDQHTAIWTSPYGRTSTAQDHQGA